MAQSHADCNHPRTPAGRAACRKAGGPNDARLAGMRNATSHHLDPPPDYDTEGDHPEAPTCEGSVGSFLVGMPARKVRTKGPEKPAGRRSRRGGTGATRTRALDHEYDLVDVPAVFGPAIRWAWEHECEVRTGLPFNDDERQIVIHSEHGWLTLVWRSGQPFGVTAVWWRPYDTSVQRRLMTVQQGITVLGSGSVD